MVRLRVVDEQKLLKMPHKSTPWRHFFGVKGGGLSERRTYAHDEGDLHKLAWEGG